MIRTLMYAALAAVAMAVFPVSAQTVTTPPRAITSQQETPGVDSTFQGDAVPNVQTSTFRMTVTGSAPAPTPAPPPPAVTCTAQSTSKTMTQVASYPSGYTTTAGAITFTQSATQTTATTCPNGAYGAPSTKTITGAWSPTPTTACPEAKIATKKYGACAVVSPNGPDTSNVLFDLSTNHIVQTAFNSAIVLTSAELAETRTGLGNCSDSVSIYWGKNYVGANALAAGYPSSDYLTEWATYPDPVYPPRPRLVKLPCRRRRPAQSGLPQPHRRIRLFAVGDAASFTQPAPTGCTAHPQRPTSPSSRQTRFSVVA